MMVTKAAESVIILPKCHRHISSTTIFVSKISMSLYPLKENWWQIERLDGIEYQWLTLESVTNIWILSVTFLISTISVDFVWIHALKKDEILFVMDPRDNLFNSSNLEYIFVPARNVNLEGVFVSAIFYQNFVHHRNIKSDKKS